MSEPNTKIEKIENVKPDGRKKNGGRRKGSGRKPVGKDPAVKSVVETHVNEVVDVFVTDPKTNKLKTVKMTRLLAILQKLYEVAMTGSTEGLGKWLDRALGKAIQPSSLDFSSGGKAVEGNSIVFVNFTKNEADGE